MPIHWPVPPEQLDGQLALLARLGYQGVQLGESFPAPVEAVALLSRHRLRLAEVYAALPCTPDGPTSDAFDIARRRLTTLHAAGGEVLVSAIDGSPERDRWTGRADGEGVPTLTDDGWGRLADGLDHLTEEALGLGALVAFHPHTGTYVETPAEIERLLDETGVGLCVDTGHTLVGGGDPVTLIEMVGERLTHVHLKDVDPDLLAGVRGGTVPTLTEAIAGRIFCPLGTGVLDLDGVLAALDRVGYRGSLMVEQDSTWGSPAEASATSRRALAHALGRLSSGPELPTPPDSAPY